MPNIFRVHEAAKQWDTGQSLAWRAALQLDTHVVQLLDSKGLLSDGINGEVGSADLLCDTSGLTVLHVGPSDPVRTNVSSIFT
jgi:hypothetical protein